MFSVTWGPMLAVFSVNLEVTREPMVIDMCLRGFRQAIHIRYAALPPVHVVHTPHSCLTCTPVPPCPMAHSAFVASAEHRMETERDAFVTSLAKFTFLDSVRDIQQKNIDCIKTLIAVALHEGNHLRQSWGPVLNCVSQLARLQLFAAGAKSDDTYFPEPAQAPSVREVACASRYARTGTHLRVPTSCAFPLPSTASHRVAALASSHDAVLTPAAAALARPARVATAWSETGSTPKLWRRRWATWPSTASSTPACG